MRLRLVILFALLVGVVPGQAFAARAATCTADEKAANQAALAAYQKRIGRERKAYFRTHKLPAQRKAFVKKQQAKLRRLREAAACTVPPATPPPKTQLTFTFGASVSSAQRDEVTNAAHGAVIYEAKIGSEPSKVDLRVYADAESTAEAYAAALGDSIENARRIWQFSTATGGKNGVIFLNTGARGWTESDPSHRAKILAHEIFHVVQAGLAGSAWTFPPPDVISPAGPRWLIEGAAELVGFLTIADDGMLPFSAARAENVANIKYASGPLSDYATQSGIDRHPTAQYNLFFVAVDYLTRGKGVTALVQFWQEVGRGTAWQDAFRDAFGTTVEAFYADFERYRASL